jgi:hypothetical protein
LRWGQCVVAIPREDTLYLVALHNFLLHYLGRQVEPGFPLQSLLQLPAKGLAASQNSGLHSTKRDIENLRDLFITQILNISKNYRRAKAGSQLSQCGLDETVSLAIQHIVEGSASGSRQNVAISPGILVPFQTHFLPAMPSVPPAVIVRLVDGDPVNPRLQAAVPPEGIDLAKDLQEDFLDHVTSLARIPQ